MTSIVELDTVLTVIAAAFLAGVGVTTAFSLAVLGTTRVADMRRSGRPVAAGAFVVVAAVGIIVCVAAIGYGLKEMTAT